LGEGRSRESDNQDEGRDFCKKEKKKQTGERLEFHEARKVHGKTLKKSKNANHDNENFQKISKEVGRVQRRGKSGGSCRFWGSGGFHTMFIVNQKKMGGGRCIVRTWGRKGKRRYARSVPLVREKVGFFNEIVVELKGTERRQERSEQRHQKKVRGRR